MSSATSILQQIETAIGQQETSGGTAGVGSTLNNPGAIKYASWETAFGATPTTSGFAQFPDLTSGWNALNALVTKYVNSGASISSMMQAYAPVAENPTTPARITQLANLTGLDPNSSIASQVSALSTAPTGGVIGSTVGGILQSASNGVASATGGILGNTDTTTGGTNTIGSITWSRAAAFLGGLVALIMGLSMLKQTQFIVQPIINTAKDVGSNVAKGAGAAAVVA